MEKTLTTAAATYINNVQLYATYTLKPKFSTNTMLSFLSNNIFIYKHTYI